jgi:hypothetical protein
LAGKFKKIDFGGISILKMAGKFNILKLFSEDQNGTEHSQQRTLLYIILWIYFFPNLCGFFSHYREKQEKTLL